MNYFLPKKLPPLYQLIVAHKMRQVDLKKLEQDIALEITKPGFNIFEFSQRFN